MSSSSGTIVQNTINVIITLIVQSTLSVVKCAVMLARMVTESLDTTTPVSNEGRGVVSSM